MPPPARKLKILIVSAEVAPFAKVGGLADVAGALPKALRALGHDVRVAMPSYKMIEADSRYAVGDLLPPFPVPTSDGQAERAWVRQTRIGTDIPVYLIAHDRHFTEATESKKVYTLEPEPYVFFDRAIAEFVPRISPAWRPDVIHCNDWHTGLVPVYLETFYSCHPTWADTARVFTIHNLAYPGEYSREVLHAAGLPNSLFTFDKLEFYGNMSFMKGGLVYADMVNTVSRTYAQEIQTVEYGCRMEGLLQHVASSGRLAGIINGIDYEEYNPATDPRIPAHFSVVDPAGKAKCKTALQAECGLPKSKAAVIGLISRLADQKGFDLISAIADQMLKLPVQLVVLGTGEPRYEEFFRDLQTRYPKKVSAHIGFNADLAQRIYAGSDMFLMPSRFEPCGLGQLMSLRYGTIPIVRSTGGLADTVTDFNARKGKGNGFAFAEYDAAALLRTVQRAVEAFGDTAAWEILMTAAMRSDYSWTSSARKYIDLYRRAQAAGRLADAA
jgi:starch synthase